MSENNCPFNAGIFRARTSGIRSVIIITLAWANNVGGCHVTIGPALSRDKVK